MGRYSFYLDDSIPQEKQLIDYLEKIGNKKGNAIKYLLVQGLAVNNSVLSLTVNKEYDLSKEEEINEIKIIEQDDEELDINELDIQI